MDLGVVFLLLVVLLGVVFYLAAPLMIRDPGQTMSGNREASALLAERERVINALQELDFDYQLGKIPDEDYPGQRNELIRKGVEILKKLDEMNVQGIGDIQNAKRTSETHVSDAGDVGWSPTRLETQNVMRKREEQGNPNRTSETHVSDAGD